MTLNISLACDLINLWGTCEHIRLLIIQLICHEAIIRHKADFYLLASILIFTMKLIINRELDFVIFRNGYFQVIL